MNVFIFQSPDYVWVISTVQMATPCKAYWNVSVWWRESRPQNHMSAKGKINKPPTYLAIEQKAGDHIKVNGVFVGMNLQKASTVLYQVFSFCLRELSEFAAGI